MNPYHILFIEDNEADQRLFQHYLTGQRIDGISYELTLCESIEEAQKQLQEQSFDLILLDLSLPDALGPDSYLAMQEKAPNCPIILLTGAGNSPETTHYADRGALDYIVKGEVSQSYLHRRLHYAIKYQTRFRKIKEQNLVLEKMAKTDPLTGLLSRQYGEEIIIDEINRAQRYGHHLALIMIDLDNFKTINDQYGHNKGDEALIRVGFYLQQSIRETDKPIRYAGDEFLVLLTDTRAHEAAIVARRLVHHPITIPLTQEMDYKITLSIGVVEYGYNFNLTQFIEQADRAMYQAKSLGRNQYYIAQ